MLMRRNPTPAQKTALALVLLAPLLLATASCGGGDGGTPPITITSVLITSPGAPPLLQTLGRTTQFSASARDASNAEVAGASITWQSSNAGAASVNGAGLVTAVANGTTTITAHAGGVASSGVTVTVTQAVDTILPTPTSVAFGALGATRQLAIAVVDSSDAAVGGAPAPTWTRVGSGTVASVSATGLVTALAIGNSDTAVATLGSKTARVPISVSQVVASVFVTPAAQDTLRTTGSTKQFAAVARDSQANDMGTAISWSSSSPGVFMMDAVSGEATAVSDGSAQVLATADGVTGSRTLVVRRYPATFVLGPSSASITTAGGIQVFTGDAKDSVNTVLTINWSSNSGSVLTVSPASGTQTTATATGNGTTYVVMQSGGRRDSAQVTVTNQAPAFPSAVTVTVGDFFFRSNRNLSEAPAVDTIGVGGEVTWSFGSGPHNVSSTDPPTFPGSPNLSSGTFVRTFGAVGVYQYFCGLHPGMTGRIHVR
jgi:plastocyanin